MLSGRAYPGVLGAPGERAGLRLGSRGKIAGVVGPRRRTPWWGLLSATAAPVLLIGGWTLAASRQQGGFDPVRRTISALAARDADDRWVMTTALVGLGLCHVTTALAVRRAASPGRLLLAVGGVATVLVAAFPQPGADRSSAAHTAAAGTAFVALAAGRCWLGVPGRILCCPRRCR
jgi:hypothetical membrane protein